MGCGISTFEAEGAPRNRQSNLLRRYRIIRPISDNAPSTKQLLDDGNGNGDDGVDSTSIQNRESVSSPPSNAKPPALPDVKAKQEDCKDIDDIDKVKEKRLVKKEAEKDNDKAEDEESEAVEKEDSDRDDHLTAAGSPSFREYCIHSNPVAPSFRDNCLAFDSSEDTSHISGNVVALMSQNKPQKEEALNTSKDERKKERRARGFRNVLPKGRPGGKKNMLNPSHASNVDGPHEIAGKAS